MSNETSPRTEKLRFLAKIASVGMASALIGSGTVRGAEDPIAYAKSVVEAGRLSKMSRSGLQEGGVVWSGAESSPKPIAKAKVAVMPCPLALDVCKYLFESAKAAATAIGWEAFPVDNKGDPAVAQKGIDAAINQGVNCVLTLASPARDIRQQIKRGKEQGVAFVTGFSDDPVQFGGDVGYGLDYGAAGQLLGAFIVANGGGGVVLFDAPQLPQLSERLNGVKDYIEKHGGGLATIVRKEDFSLADGSPGLITKMQALLTRYPKDSIKWVVGPYDEAVLPLLETAAQRGRPEIKGLGFDGEPVTYDSLRKGGAQAATISWGLEWVAWAGIDECNRALNKAPVGVNKDFPIQLTDSTNVPPPGEKYKIDFDFKKKYMDMWQH
jgi:ABC-type sugar transport system substrate-binding protein